MTASLGGADGAVCSTGDGLAHLALAAAEGHSGDLREFVDVVRYSLSQPEMPLEATEVRVMSLHKSKGLTADVVVVAGLVEGLLPHVDPRRTPQEQTASKEERRRLLFVGITRTRRSLVLSTYAQLDGATAHCLQVAKGRYLPGGAYRTLASSFLGGLGPALPAGSRGPGTSR
jgi:DNA helicase II / ATP-dependent DNA helicase PcrA